MFNLTNANRTELQKSTSSFFFWWWPDPELGTERQCVLWQAPNYLEMSVYHKGCWCSVSGTIRHTLALLNFIHPPAWMWPHGNLSRISRCFHTSLSPLRCRRQKTLWACAFYGSSADEWIWYVCRRRNYLYCPSISDIWITCCLILVMSCSASKAALQAFCVFQHCSFGRSKETWARLLQGRTEWWKSEMWQHYISPIWNITKPFSP